MFACVFLVHPSGFEPETVRVGGENSIQLNYGCIGIPFVITNYFCGNKSVFAMLNNHQCTSSTISVVCLAKTVPQAAISYPQKCVAPKRTYF